MGTLAQLLPADSPVNDFLGAYKTVDAALDAAAAVGVYLPADVAKHVANAGLGLYGAPGTWYGATVDRTTDALASNITTNTVSLAPVVGGALAAWNAYNQTGEIGDAITQGALTAIGTVLGGPMGAAFASLLGSTLFTGKPNIVHVPELLKYNFTTPTGQVSLHLGSASEGSDISVEDLSKAMLKVQELQKQESAISNALAELAVNDPNFNYQQAIDFGNIYTTGTRNTLTPDNADDLINTRWNLFIDQVPGVKIAFENSGLSKEDFINQYASPQEQISGLHEEYWSNVDNVPLFKDQEDIYSVPRSASTGGDLWYTPEQTIVQGQDTANLYLGSNTTTTPNYLESDPLYAQIMSMPNAPPSITQQVLDTLKLNPQMISILYG